MDAIFRRLIKNADQLDDPEVRRSYGSLAGIFGIICNTCLAALKLVLGWLSGSVSIMGDAVNNLSDSVSAIVTLVGFKLSGKPADKDHPYGHGRMEYLAGFVVAAAVLAVAMDLFITSFKKVLKPGEMTITWLTLIMLVVSIVVKVIMAMFYKAVGKRVPSATMRALVTDSLSDCLNTAVAIISSSLIFFADINLDGIAGCIVALLVMKNGYEALTDTMMPLLGTAAPEEDREKLREIIKGYPQILETHDFRMHDYGAGRCYMTFHAELSGAMTFLEAHEVINAVEHDISKALGVEATIHMDPVVLDNEELIEVKKAVKEIVMAVGAEWDASFGAHDIRLVNCSRSELIEHGDFKKLCFEVMVPYTVKAKDEEIREKLFAAAKERFPELTPEIVVDRGGNS